ncbi:MAG: hypothetical protein LBG50_03585 [Clostridiales Family XIII bacterium]|jgi:hypothetical protein|nr:hypothetical protein [Clostridiales Family XIII bacterium]
MRNERNGDSDMDDNSNRTIGANGMGGQQAAKMICGMDGAEMELMEAEFSYLGRGFKHKVLRCPVCGQVHIPEDIAAGRMREVELALENK